MTELTQFLTSRLTKKTIILIQTQTPAYDIFFDTFEAKNGRLCSLQLTFEFP